MDTEIPSNGASWCRCRLRSISSCRACRNRGPIIPIPGKHGETSDQNFGKNHEKSDKIMENLGIELEKTSEDYRSQGMSPTTTIWDDDIPWYTHKMSIEWENMRFLTSNQDKCRASSFSKRLPCHDFLPPAQGVWHSTSMPMSSAADRCRAKNAENALGQQRLQRLPRFLRLHLRSKTQKFPKGLWGYGSFGDPYRNWPSICWFQHIPSQALSFLRVSEASWLHVSG